MTATNHFLTGALVGILVGRPLPAILLAIVSHFILDDMPHFGDPNWFNANRNTALAKKVWQVDVLALVTAVVLVTIRSNSALPVIAGVAAAAPDLPWVYRYIFKEKWGRLIPGPMNWFNTWHNNLQWGEFSKGWLVEILVCVVLFIAIINRT